MFVPLIEAGGMVSLALGNALRRQPKWKTAGSFVSKNRQDLSHKKEPGDGAGEDSAYSLIHGNTEREREREREIEESKFSNTALSL